MKSIQIKKTPHYRLRKEVVSKIESFGYLVHDKNAIWFTAYYEGKYAGFGGLWLLKHPIAYLGPSYTKEEFRGCGIQRALIEERLKVATELKIEKVWSRTDWENITSARNLIRCGFNLDKPTICGIMESGHFTVTLDGAEMLEAERYELFFSKSL